MCDIQQQLLSEFGHFQEKKNFHCKSVCYQFLVGREFIRDPEEGIGPRKSFHRGFKWGLATFKIAPSPKSAILLKNWNRCKYISN